MSDEKVWLDTTASVDWGFVEKNEDGSESFVVLPKLPMIRAGHVMPPFDITLPTGAVRHIIERLKE